MTRDSKWDFSASELLPYDYDPGKECIPHGETWCEDCEKCSRCGEYDYWTATGICEPCTDELAEYAAWEAEPAGSN